MTRTATAFAPKPTTGFAAFALDVCPVSYQQLMNRREAEQLFIIDAAKDARDPQWESYFVEQLVEFLVHSRRPTGVITEADADWLVSQFDQEPSPSVPALLRALVSEAETIPPVIIGYALSCGAMRI